MQARVREDMDLLFFITTMKETKKQFILFAIVMAAFLVAIGIVGRVDQTVEIIESMPRGVYMAVKSVVGQDASDYDIADEYMCHKEMYDTLYGE